jgi:sugar fermentation stimulation protein A
VASLEPPSTDLWTIRAPGTYLLVLRLDAATQIEVGRLGRVAFPAGWYVYIGSALGGLGARLRRHARLEKRHHWHVDVLRAASILVAIAVRLSSERIECETAATVARLIGGSQPVLRFGSSDCHCRSHLVYFAGEPQLRLAPGWQTVRLGG